MRRVDTREALPEALQAAMREADAAFGDPTMFLEQAVLRPRHIEVQILADAEGNVMHLFERDCSSSAGTRRSSRSPRRRTWTRTSARRSTATP